MLQDVAPSRGIWAPTIRFYNDTFYVASVNMDGGGNFFVTAKNPAGPWSKPVYVPMKSIDPNLFFENDKLYFMTPQTKSKGSVRGIYMAEINPITGQLKTEERLLWQGSGGKCLEGPHLYHIGEWYYLLAAEGGTKYGHMITVSRSKSLWGPYESCPTNPIITNRDDHDNPLQCTGHGDLVQSPDGSWAMVLLASRWGTKWHSQLGRETCIVPIAWEDGWPRLSSGGHNVHVQQNIPWLKYPQISNTGFSIDFSKKTWDFSLNFLRHPNQSAYQTNPCGSLILRGGTSLSELGSPTFIGHRQQLMSCRCSVNMKFTPQNKAEAGLTVYLSHRYHFDFAKKLENGQPVIILRQTVGKYLSTVTAQIPATDSELTLIVESVPAEYRFFISQGGAEPVLLGCAEARLISNELAKLFTGVYFGLYCVDEIGDSFAVFQNFECISR